MYLYKRLLGLMARRRLNDLYYLLKIFPGLNYNFYVVNKDSSYFFCVHTQVFFHEENMKVKEMTCDKKRLREKDN